MKPKKSTGAGYARRKGLKQVIVQITPKQHQQWTDAAACESQTLSAFIREVMANAARSRNGSHRPKKYTSCR
ncbi:MAG TPA: hypothetical protein VNH19_18925 [Candidatus Limnocylindrales bacterium]|nr:hypothetical protein [Candidatus Limnocylindrales bacterium]